MRRAGTALVAGLLALVACADDGGSDGAERDDGSAIIVTTTVADTTSTAPTTATPTAPATTATAGSVAESSPATTSTVPATTPPTTIPPEPVVGDPVVGSELVAEVAQPVDLAVRPGDDGLHVVSQPGRIVRIDPTTGEQRTTFDIVGRVATGGEQGLLGLAFSPDGALAYVDFTDGDGDTTIAEYAVLDDGTLDQSTERIVLVVDQPYGNHNAGDLAFGPDEMLYVTLGDGGSGGDPERRASDPGRLLGSLLRIDPTPSGDRPYTIPADNPFASGPRDGREGAPEVWSFGLRNPWKIAFDPVNGDLWIADVGQNAYEEVDRVQPGDHPAGFGVDFGWSAFEGTERFNDDVPDTGTTTFPVLVYEHGSDGCSISGGVPYRGTAIAELAPAYVYSDYCSGIVWALDLAGGRNLVLLDGFSDVTGVRSGPGDELYVLERGGRVHRLVQG